MSCPLISRSPPAPNLDVRLKCFYGSCYFNIKKIQTSIFSFLLFQVHPKTCKTITPPVVEHRLLVPCVMKLEPNQAPLCGESVLTVLLDEGPEIEDGLALYLVFFGSGQQHVTSTHRAAPSTLHTVAPAHNCCETVRVGLYACGAGDAVQVLAEESFQYVPDMARTIPLFLGASAGSEEAPGGPGFLGDFSVPVEDLDKDLRLAVKHLALSSLGGVPAPGELPPGRDGREWGSGGNPWRLEGL
uniref:Uncharacterized protein n=1 Tax=Callorhinchus milii TaxID=7868 RepID=A0A4W3HZ59_CALMI